MKTKSDPTAIKTGSGAAAAARAVPFYDAEELAHRYETLTGEQEALLKERRSLMHDLQVAEDEARAFRDKAVELVKDRQLEAARLMQVTPRPSPPTAHRCPPMIHTTPTNTPPPSLPPSLAAARWQPTRRHADTTAILTTAPHPPTHRQHHHHGAGRRRVRPTPPGQVKRTPWPRAVRPRRWWRWRWRWRWPTSIICIR